MIFFSNFFTRIKSQNSLEVDQNDWIIQRKLKKYPWWNSKSFSKKLVSWLICFWLCYVPIKEIIVLSKLNLYYTSLNSLSEFNVFNKQWHENNIWMIYLELGDSGHVEPTQPRKPYEVQSLIVQKKYFRPCFWKPINTFRPLPCIVLKQLGYGFKPG